MRDDWETDKAVIEEELEETGAVSRCPVHDYLLDALDSGATGEAIENLEEVYGRDRAEELVQRVMADLPDECPGCPSDSD